MIFYGNGMKDVFENSNSGTEDEMGYCVTDYYPDFDAFILFEGTPQGNRFYWVNRISGQRAPVGFSRELSPALDRFVSVENGGCDDPREPRSVGVWNVSPGMVHNEFREAYKEFPKDTKECPYGAQWNGPNEIRVAFLTVPYPAKIIRSLVYKDNEWTWTTENEKRIGP